MKKLLFSFVFLVSGTAAQAQHMARVKATIDTLTAPGMHGRGYVNYGDRHAAAYLKQQFAQIGLQPIGDTYFQFFTLTVNTFPDRVALKAGSKLLEPGIDFIPFADSGAGEGRFTVETIDSTLLRNPAQVRRLLGKNLKKRVLVFSSPRAYSLAMEYNNSVLPAKLQTAGAMVTLTTKKLTMPVRATQKNQPYLEVKKSAWPANTKKVRLAVDAGLLQNHISQNVIGCLSGSTKPDSFIVVTAHYDHLGRLGRDAYFPGANDNASGTAMLLELARHYAQPENAPEYSMLFIGFSGEEAGLVGSKFYTEHPLVPLPQTKFLLNLDLMGNGSEGMMVVNGKVFEKEFALLENVNERQKLLPELKKRGEAANSDHYHFTQKGVRGFFFYTLGGSTAYHDVFDTADQLPLDGFTGVFRLITAFVSALENGE